MEIEVALPNGSVIMFPAGTDPAKIKEVARRAAAGPAPTAPIATRRPDSNLAVAPGTTDEMASRIPDGMVYDPATGGYFDAAAQAERGGMTGGVATKYMQGTPFVGQYVDEAAGAIDSALTGASPELAQETVRQSQAMMDRDHPRVAAAAQLTGGVVGSLPLVAAAPAATSRIAGFGPRMAATGVAAGTVGAMEGRVSGYGAGNDGDRNASGNMGGLIGAGVGAGVGVAAPMVAEGMKNALMAFKSSDIGTIASTLGISQNAAKAIRVALDGEDIGAATANIARGGPNAMLAEAGPSTQALAKGVKSSGGEATRIMSDAIRERSDQGAAQVAQGLDDAFKPGTSVIPQPPKLGTAYDAAYARPINYSSDAGRRIEALSRRVPPEQFAKARRLIEMDPNIPDDIKKQFLVSIQPDGTLKTGALPSTLELDYVTRALNDVGKSGDGKGALGGNTNEGRIYKGLATRIRDEMKTDNPLYKQALDFASTEIGIQEARDFGATVMRPSVTRAMVRDQLAGAPEAERLAAKAAIKEAVDDSLANVRRIMSNPDASTEVGEAIKAVKDFSSRAARDKIAMVLGPKEADKLVATMDEAATAFEIQAALSRNSDTAVNQAVQGSIRQSVSPSALGMLMRGEPLQATKRLTQIFTGSTPEAQQAVEAGIYAEIAKALTSIKGTRAQAALQQVNAAMRGQTMNEAAARRLANLTAAALATGGYQTGNRALTAP